VSGKTITDWCKNVHEWAVGKGWWEKKDRNFPEQIALMHSELSEALEEFRKWGLDPKVFLYDDWSESGIACLPVEPIYTGRGKPEGIASELADVVIRIMDTCGAYGIDLEGAIEAKMAYNHTRPHRHGNKHA
jgi:NTP pyrophosphatase (non-canonical NTP hydrolase)